MMLKLLPIYLFSILLLMASCGRNIGEFEPTCFDGVQNQDETGIDCGGQCSGPCPTCNDGIQNQGEAGIDCGGPCPQTCTSVPCTTCLNPVQGSSQTFCQNDFQSQEAYQNAINNAIANGSSCQ